MEPGESPYVPPVQRNICIDDDRKAGSEGRGMLMETIDDLKREIEKLKTAGSMQATELLKERTKDKNLRGII